MIVHTERVRQTKICLSNIQKKLLMVKKKKETKHKIITTQSWQLQPQFLANFTEKNLQMK